MDIRSSASSSEANIVVGVLRQIALCILLGLHFPVLVYIRLDAWTPTPAIWNKRWGKADYGCSYQVVASSSRTWSQGRED